jgi:hypothetical protein
MQFILLLVALIVVSTSVQASGWDAPWFCHGIDCPEFTQDEVDGIETRAYESKQWASTTVMGTDLDTAMDTGFQRLFDYISGANEAGSKINMTAPVLNKITPGAGPNCDTTFEISFFVPYNLQGETPPKPTSDLVYTQTLPKMNVAVKEFGGFAKSKEIIAEAAELESSVGKAEDIEAENEEIWYYAGYDPPFRLTNRHNEVWVPLK